MEVAIPLNYLKKNHADLEGGRRYLRRIFGFWDWARETKGFRGASCWGFFLAEGRVGWLGSRVPDLDAI